MNGLFLLMKREVIDKWVHQDYLTLQYQNIEGEVFGKTHLLVEQVSRSHSVKANVVFENIMGQRMNDFETLLIIRLI